MLLSKEVKVFIQQKKILTDPLERCVLVYPIDLCIPGWEYMYPSFQKQSCACLMVLLGESG